MFKRFFQSLLGSGWDLGERRQAIREKCGVPVELESGNQRLQGKVLDISMTGARLEVSGAFKGRILSPGRNIQLRNIDAEHKYRDAYVSATIHWMQQKHKTGYEVGVRFEPVDVDVSWVITVLKTLPVAGKFKQKRSFTRVTSQLGVHYLVEGQAPREGYLTNLSLRGARLECRHLLSVGCQVAITTVPSAGQEPLRLVGEVLWAGRHMAVHQHGIVFAPMPSDPQRALERCLRRIVKRS